MNKLISDIEKLPTAVLPILSDEQAGQRFRKWSFVNIYSLTVLRDVYILTRKAEKKTVKSITIKVNENQIKKDIEKKFTAFTERQVLENLNALVKFDFLYEDYIVKKKCFLHSQVNTKLSDGDKQILESIFFSYFRFNELSSWLISPTTDFHINFDKLQKDDFINKSKPIYFYSDKSRFYNCFLIDIENPNTKYIIDNDVVMRFWDVYIKWGKTLGILDKFNVSKIFNPINNKEVSIAYFIKDFKPFDFRKFLSENFNSRDIWMPELIYKIAEKYRYSVNEIKKYIIQNIHTDDKLTFERTSEIFLIKGKTSEKNIKDAIYLYPLIDDYYISNLIIRK